MNTLLEEIKGCRLCVKHLPHGINPVVSASAESRILIIGQAPGRIVHNTGIPWNDKSGDNLRSWMGVDRETFYDPSLFAIMPMGFCYPGKGKSGDLPPRSECAPLWHQRILQSLQSIELILLIGQYAQAHYLPGKASLRLTDTVKNFRHFLPRYFALPHPSPRNNIWRKKNSWFDEEVLPELKHSVSQILIG